MGILGFGGSKSKNRSQQSSSSQQNVFGPQAAGLDYAYGAGTDLAQRLQPQAEQLAPQLSNQFLGQGQSFLGQLDVNQNPFLQGLQQFNNAEQTQAQVDQFGQDVNKQLGLSNFAAGQQQSLSGNRGGSRQGVAEGILAGEALDVFGRGSAQIRGQAQQQMLQALQSGAGISSQGAVGGLSQLPGQFELGLGGLSGQFSPLESLAGLAPPIVLGESQSQGTSSGSSADFNIGFG